MFDPDAWPPGFKMMIEDPDAEHSIRLRQTGLTYFVGCKCGWAEPTDSAWTGAKEKYLSHLPTTVPSPRHSVEEA